MRKPSFPYRNVWNLTDLQLEEMYIYQPDSGPVFNYVIMA